MTDAPFAVPGLEGFTPPLGASDAEIDAAVDGVGLLPLLMSIVHITGDLAILRAAGPTLRPQYSTDLSGSIPADTQVLLRATAAQAIKTWRDAGCPAAHVPDPLQLREMITALVGKTLDPRYEPMLAEELGFEGDARAFQWDRPVDDAAKAAKPVLIVGAGLSGLVMGYRLKQAGVPFTIIEKNSGPGGTWFENRFPGARVDVPSHCYSFSFVRDQVWPELFSPWPVLRSYFSDLADRLGLTPHIRYDTEVLRAAYDADTAHWDVVLRSPQGEDAVRVAVLVSAVGQLNRPLIPDIEGQDAFRGLQVHTSHWPDGLSTAGKKVIVIGTAATALQIVPELAETADHLTVFQRSPTWAFVHPEYRRELSDAEHWAMDALPGYARWTRVIMYNWALDGSPDHMLIDPEWTGGSHAVSAANAAARERLVKGMTAAIGDDPELIAKLIPTYPPYVKRPNLGDGGYFRAFRRDNVTLCTDGAVRFDETGVIDGRGVHHDADIVVYATGFKALEYLAPMEITGRSGQRIEQFWGDEPRAHLGVTVPDFPNLFLLYGPGTNLGFNGNLFFNAECQAGYVAQALKWMIQDDIDALELKPDVYADYSARMDAALSRFTWSHASAGSWYKNASGKVIANSPWPLVDYWEWTRSPAPADFVVVRGSTAAQPARAVGDKR